MSPEDVKKLLGGYATGTLTAEEQQALFAAALEDQELFDALAREQSLRDLLRDPASRAELLTALDRPANRLGGFWPWLRRPMVAGLATASVVAIAVLAVWQGTRFSRPTLADRVMVAELKRSDVQSAPQAPAPAAPLAVPPQAKDRAKDIAAPAAAVADKKAVPAPVSPREMQALDERRAEVGANAPVAVATPSPPSAPAAAPPALMARKAEADATSAAPSPQLAGGVKESVTIDARAIFYAGQPAAGVNAFVAPSGGGGAVPPPARQAAPKAVSGLAASKAVPAPRLGVRVSILRGGSEVDLTTVLDPGETVRLKVVPNADGFLYVAEGTRLVASGTAQRLKPFETPELSFQGSGQKQLLVMLSLRPQAVVPPSLGTLGRGNLVESSADQDRATYFVSGLGEPSAQQVVVPVTLTYR